MIGDSLYCLIKESFRAFELVMLVLGDLRLLTLSVKPQEAGERGDEEEELRRRVAKRQRDYCTESQGPTTTVQKSVFFTLAIMKRCH